MCEADHLHGLPGKQRRRAVAACRGFFAHGVGVGPGGDPALPPRVAAWLAAPGTLGGREAASQACPLRRAEEDRGSRRARAALPPPPEPGDVTPPCHFIMPECERWPQRPVFVRFHPLRPVRTTCCRAVPVNARQSVPFETPLFGGTITIAFRNTPNSESDPWAAGERFHTKRRHVVMCVQGHFKRRLRYDDVLCGLQWERPLQNLPWALRPLIAIIQATSPGAVMDLHAAQPSILNTLILSADAVHCWDPSKHPVYDKYDVFSRPCPERLDERWTTRRQRQGFFGRAGAMEGWYFEPANEYTFDFYGDKITLSEYVAWIGPLTVSLGRFFGQQPYPFCWRTRSTNEFLLSIDCWHESVAPRAGADDMAGMTWGGSSPWSDASNTMADSRSLSRNSSFQSIQSNEHGSGHGSTTMAHRLHSHGSQGGGFSVYSAGSFDSDDMQTVEGDGSRDDLQPGDEQGRRRRMARVRRVATAARARTGNWRENRAHRWEAWDTWDGDPQGFRVCASLLFVVIMCCLAWVAAFWPNLLFTRLHGAIRPPAGRKWGNAMLAGGVGFACLIFVGTLTDFFRQQGNKPAVRERAALAKLLATAAVFALAEEVAFRVILLPSAAEPTQLRELVLWCVLSDAMFVGHLPLLSVAMRIGYPTFLDPRFLVLAATLGAMTSAAFCVSGSLWPAFVLHCSALWLWLLHFGGARRLRRVRISVPPTDRGMSPPHHAAHRQGSHRISGGSSGSGGELAYHLMGADGGSPRGTPRGDYRPRSGLRTPRCHPVPAPPAGDDLSDGARRQPQRFRSLTKPPAVLRAEVEVEAVHLPSCVVDLPTAPDSGHGEVSPESPSGSPPRQKSWRDAAGGGVPGQRVPTSPFVQQAGVSLLDADQHC